MVCLRVRALAWRVADRFEPKRVPRFLWWCRVASAPRTPSLCREVEDGVHEGNNRYPPKTALFYSPLQSCFYKGGNDPGFFTGRCSLVRFLLREQHGFVHKEEGEGRGAVWVCSAVLIIAGAGLQREDPPSA